MTLNRESPNKAAARCSRSSAEGCADSAAGNSKQLFVSIGDLPGLGLNLSTHSGVAWHYGHDLLHHSKSLESLEVVEQAGHQTMIAHMKRVAGLATARLGNANGGRSLVREGLKRSEDLGDLGGMPLGLAFLGLLETWAGNREPAVSAFRDSIIANRGLGQVWPSLLTIAFGAEQAGLNGRPADAIRLASAVDSMTERTRIRLAPHDRVRVGLAVEGSMSLLEPNDVAKVRVEGAQISIPNAMLLALDVFEH